jgi:hypothetical protein
VRDASIGQVLERLGVYKRTIQVKNEGLDHGNPEIAQMGEIMQSNIWVVCPTVGLTPR